MIAKLVVEDKEFDIEILDPKLQELIAPKKKTGYERADYNKIYFTECCGYVQSYADWGKDIDESYYKCANYYSDKTVAENNTRADNLMRQLRRFAVEHRNKEIDWSKEDYKYTIRYGHGIKQITHSWEIAGQEFGCIWFDSLDATQLAIETFRDELIWYFTEYKDSL
jgi:hypothetical protein